jgi:hypothetical protein
VLAVLAAAATARSDQVAATFDTVNPGEVVSITSGGTTWNGVWAGEYDFRNASGVLNGYLRGFCIDINQDIYWNQTVTFDVASLKDAPVPGPSMGPLRARLIRELWANDFNRIGTSNSNAAAFQLAVWEIINETKTNADGTLALGLNGGTFTATDSDGATITTANTWLSQLDLHGSGTQDGSLIALTNSQYQDYVMSVPAPPGLVLGSAGAVSLLLAGVWQCLRRRLRKVAA